MPRVLTVLAVALGALAGAEAHWHTGVEGIGVDEIVAEWPLRQATAPVVVAVLDSGFDLDHPALAPVLWTNPGEAAGVAGVDDDGNGFIDDRHGWSFLSSRDGVDLTEARMEVTRLYARLRPLVDAGVLESSDTTWREIEAAFRQAQGKWASRYREAYLMAAVRKQALADLEAAGADITDEAALAAFEPSTWRARAALSALKSFASGSKARRAEALVIEGERWLEVGYNPHFSESAIVGDDPYDVTERDYGSPQLSVGWRDSHGTMVAAVIGGAAWPEHGTRGICPSVKLMLLRTTPYGDERDKDVANGIRYAVANGARIINLSFGKPWSPEKPWVDAAMREAEAAGVLVVNSAGNSGHEVTAHNTFPNPHHAAGRFDNWLAVGACAPGRHGWYARAASFTNWSPSEVDLLAPGSDITAPSADGGISTSDGTSFAAPCVSGVAALLWSQFPAASVQQVKAAILEGTRRPEHPFSRPGSGELVPLSSLCASGGILDARGALVALARSLGDESVLPPELRQEAP